MNYMPFHQDTEEIFYFQIEVESDADIFSFCRELFNLQIAFCSADTSSVYKLNTLFDL